MGVLGFPSRDDFEEFKALVQSQISEIEKKLTLTAGESAELAKEAVLRIGAIESDAKSSAERLREIIVEADQLDDQAAELSAELKDELDSLKNIHAEIAEKRTSSNEDLGIISRSKAEIDAAVSDVREKISEINSYIEQSQGFPEKIEELSSQLEAIEESADKINSLLVHSLKKKGEIDDLYKRIYGEDIKVDDGEVQHTEGVIDELKRAYDSVSDKLEKLAPKIDSSIADATLNFDNKLNVKSKEFESLVSDSREVVENITKQLKDLLPGAMATGLSAAYENKTLDEIKSLEGFNKTFKWAIFGLVVISLIPFAVDIYLLGWQAKDLVQVIKDTPSLIVSILPLYFPVLWLAYSSNKKINLSKRLIEEYTHKSVLGKTFSGLSNQIDKLPGDDSIKDELRTRLLFNVLQVSSENPGKLISNYQKSDHPLMEALENSAKLSDSVEVLTKIPGFGALAKKLSERSEGLLDEQVKKVERGLKAQDNFNI